MSYKPLSQVAEIVMGQSPKGENYNSEGLGLPLLNGPTEFGVHHPFPTLFTEDSKRECKPGALIFCVRGSTTGRMNWADQIYSLGRGVCSIDAGNKLENRFIRYCIADGLEALLKLAGGGTFPNLTKDDIHDFEISWPQQRRKIAAILSAYDDLIENNTRRVQVLEQMARALYREWFVEYRFPGHEQAEWVEDEAGGRRPKGWEWGVFGDIAAVTTRSVNPAKHPEEEFEHFSLPAFDAGQLPSLEYGETIKSNKNLVPQDCVLLPKLNPRIPRVWLPPAPQGKRQICSTEFLPLLPLKGYGKYWLFSFCANPDFMDELTSMSSGTSTSHQRISPKGLAIFPVVLPPKELVQRFNELMGPNLELAMSLRQRNANLRRTRDLLLPRLVSGELDVSGLRVAGAGLEDGMTQEEN